MGTVVDVLEAPRTERESDLGVYGNDTYINRSYVNLCSIQEDPVSAVTEMLEEWGYCGPPETAPAFLKRKLH